MKTYWDVNGFLVIPGLLNESQVASLRELCKSVKDQFLRCDALTGLPGGDPAVETCMRHVIHPSYFIGQRYKLQELLEICVNSNIVEALRVCFGEEPIFRSTSLFFNPTNLQQNGNWHRDTQFVYKDIQEEQTAIEKFAKTGGDGIQVQLPLFKNEDLEYIPGSHRRWDNEDELFIRLGNNEANCRQSMANGNRISTYHGDAVLFDPNGIHRGRYYSSINRLTLMITFTKASALPKVDRFSYQPWFLDENYLSGISTDAEKTYAKFLRHYREAWSASKDIIGKLHSGRRSQIHVR